MRQFGFFGISCSKFSIYEYIKGYANFFTLYVIISQNTFSLIGGMDSISIYYGDLSYTQKNFLPLSNIFIIVIVIG